MPSDNPQTPQSPSTTPYSVTHLPRKQSTSPRTSHSLPTPAHSINGSMSSMSSDVAMEGHHDDVSNKRKRDAEDHGDRDQKKVHIEGGKVGIEQLHLPVGDAYLLCRTPHPPRVPDLKQDLFQLYGLEDIAKSVERGREVTDANGQKVNQGGVKLRKSYKNHLKVHKISGSFDENKKEIDAPDTLFAMMMAPEDEWNAQNVRGKDLSKGLSEIVLSSLGKALTMAKGPIPKALFDADKLAFPTEVANQNVVAAAKTLPIGNKASAPLNPNVARTKSELPRPKRNVKKRTYGDSSYEGYGEGYVDDDTQETGYSTGDGDDRSGSRKRPKKTTQSHGFPGAPMRQNSYGPGMVGA